MAFGERESVLACDPVAMAVTKGGLWDAHISRNLRDGSALQSGRTELVEDIANVGVFRDVMLTFHRRLTVEIIKKMKW
jgi:hypothetical protein